MPWKKGKVRFDDGTVYPAELLVKDNGEVWNMKVYKDGGVIEEIDAQEFASKFGKSAEEVYPFRYEIED
ncbi:hypothetical protein [Caldisalinibacter kiritimatiensis]|uniref:Uncharacterized protein n=1 Tax=Caldisalinibacter kiritimatiensis TaxID=1304284 RepID=R1CS23_9FIRM|nr:hypothetical protein [Caldisalinibacter kiritimatiensis]EOC99483.1 hypothetical protein L21TH_2488 [Caldisalinibacter kiritimatiensis]